MPSIDYDRLKAEIPLARLLDHLGWTHRYVSEKGFRRGRCPLHGGSSTRSRSFSADLATNSWYCHRCKVGGSVIDLWQRLHPGLELHAAAADLAHTLIGAPPLLAPRGTGRGTVRERLPLDRGTSAGGWSPTSYRYADRTTDREDYP